MKTINLTQKFDFDFFMKTRGWSSIVRIALWMILSILILARTFLQA